MSLLKQANSQIERILATWIRERMDILWARVAKESPPYSDNPIFQQYKFTNVYRISDRVSQYLIRNVQYNNNYSPEDLIFRTILFKHFNLTSTWEGLVKYYHYPITLDNFKFDSYYQAIDEIIDNEKIPIYNNAYMTAWVKDSFQQKHYGYLALFEKIFDGYWKPGSFVQNLLACKTFPELYGLVAAQPYVGDFLSYQYAIDLNYLPIWKFDENDLCIATVGSKRGIEKLLGYRPGNHAEVIRFYTKYQENLLEEYGLLEGWTNLFGRRLHHIDIQNAMCELDKYLRVSNPDIKSAGNGQGKRIKNTFKKKSEPYRLYFPKHWEISQFNDYYEVT